MDAFMTTDEIKLLEKNAKQKQRRRIAS